MQSRSAPGSISGAQVSIYRRAKQAVDQALPLVDGLVPLKPDAEDDVEALKTIVRKQLIALVEELGAPGGPRVPRVGQVFRLLAGASVSSSHVRVHPESIGGTLGDPSGPIRRDRRVSSDRRFCNFTRSDLVLDSPPAPRPAFEMTD